MHANIRRAVVGALAVVTLIFSTAVPAAAVSGTPAASRYTVCNLPQFYADGSPQAFYDFHEDVVGPGCRVIKAGAPWVAGIDFYQAKTWEHVPDGYVPIAATPVEELRARLVEVVFTVDAGKPNAYTIDWTAGPNRFAADDTYAYAAVLTFGNNRRLPVGTHTMDVTIVVNSTLCDGTSSDPSLSCFGPAPFHFSFPFTVVA